MSTNNVNEKSRENFFKALEEYDFKFDDKRNHQYFVYYNENKYVTAISPVEEPDLTERFEFTKLSYNDVIEYLSGKKSMSRARLVPVSDSNRFVITETDVKVSALHYVDRQLTEIKLGTNSIPGLLIELQGNKILVSLDAKLRDANGLNDGKYKNKVLSLYFTTPGNPMFLIQEFHIMLDDLHRGKTKLFNSDLALADCSLYTKKIFNNYHYVQK